MPSSTSPTTIVDRILDEGPIGMSAAAKIYGSFRCGRPTHPSTPIRHHLHGVVLADGRTIRLEAIRIGGRLMTSRAAVVRFVAEQQLIPPVPDSAARVETVRRPGAAASKQLDRLGI